MTNCVFAHLAYGWEFTDINPDGSQDLGRRDLIEARDQLIEDLKKTVKQFERETQNYDVSLNHSEDEFDVSSYRQINDVTDFDDWNEDLSENTDANPVVPELYRRVVGLCRELQQSDKKLIDSQLEKLGLNGPAGHPLASLLTVFEVGSDVLDGAAKDAGDLIIGIGVHRLVNFVLTYSGLASGMEAMGATYHSWVTGEV